MTTEREPCWSLSPGRAAAHDEASAGPGQEQGRGLSAGLVRADLGL